MPTAPPVLTDPGLSPDRADRATFSARSVARDDFIKNIEIPERRLALANVYANAVEAAAAAALAVPASTAALAAANYKGLWSSLAGALNIPASVFHSSAFWILKNNLANVATSQPGVSADWMGLTTRNFFFKADTSTVVFTKTAAGAASLKAGTYIDVAGTLQTFAAATAVTMPSLAAGTDYAIYACTDGSIRADANFSAPTGYTTANSRKIGGFHYSPGGHSGAPGGGDTTPQINLYSLWDLKFKPACTDPRGMALVAGGFWSDIYMLGVDHLTNGTSKYNVTIADGTSPPKIPISFGGNGSTAYGSLTWWEAGEVLASHGKRRPNYGEFSALAYGTTEATSIGADPVTTTWAAAYISKWGCAQVSGNMWQWGADLGGGAAAAGWVVNTGGRGSTYQQENAAFFGGYWGETSICGSRASVWNNSPSVSPNGLGARGVCDHLILE